MTAPRIFAALITAALLIAGLTMLSCAAPPPAPLPTYTPYPTQSPLPTLTPFPTWTPAPTTTPYPTATAYPTLTPFPTWTPAPTRTPLPTQTPYPTYTPAPTSAWPQWQTYRHNDDRDDGGECDNRPNFEVELPPLWTTESADCESVEFTAPNSEALLQIEIYDLPGYSSSPWSALEDLIQFFSSDGNYDVVARIVHRDGPAIYLESTVTSEPDSQFCTSFHRELLILAQSWGSNSQRVINAIMTQCESAYQHETDLMRVLSSFRLVAPY